MLYVTSWEDTDTDIEGRAAILLLECVQVARLDYD